LLPLPDSPTMARVFPACTSKSMPCRTSMPRSPEPKETVRPRTLSSGGCSSMAGLPMSASLQLGIEAIAQGIAQQTASDHQNGKKDPRNGGYPPRGAQEVAPIGNGDAPAGRTCRRAEAKEGQRGFRQDDGAH